MAVHIVLGVIVCKCKHIRVVRAELEKAANLNVHAQARVVLAQACTYESICPVLRHVFRFGSETLGLSVDVAASGASPGRSVKFILPPSTSGRRVRIDGDLKRVLVEEETQKKRSRTIQESASVLEIAEGNPGNVRRWVSDYMR
eukprot:3325469-Amphidinium_carterae.2